MKMEMWLFGQADDRPSSKILSGSNHVLTGWFGCGHLASDFLPLILQATQI